MQKQSKLWQWLTSQESSYPPKTWTVNLAHMLWVSILICFGAVMGVVFTLRLSNQCLDTSNFFYQSEDVLLPRAIGPTITTSASSLPKFTTNSSFDSNSSSSSSSSSSLLTTRINSSLHSKTNDLSSNPTTSSNSSTPNDDSFFSNSTNDSLLPNSTSSSDGSLPKLACEHDSKQALNLDQVYNLDGILQSISSIHHNMSDDELLWFASLMAPRRQVLPFKRVPKLAFLFLTKGPLPLAPLWEIFFKGHEGLYSIYVHTHPDYKLDVNSSSPFYERQIQSKEAYWGDVTLLDAERRLLANALLDLENERFILVSETCIPLYSFNIIYDYLIGSNVSFVSSYDDPGVGGRGRYNYLMEPFIKLEQWRKGSQWFEVNRRLAIKIISDVLYYQQFQQFCKPGCYVDEHYIPTYLSIEFGSEIADRSITSVDWSWGGPHPVTFGKDDITKDLITRIRGEGSCEHKENPQEICFLFARKFSPETLDNVLQLAPEFIGT